MDAAVAVPLGKDRGCAAEESIVILSMIWHCTAVRSRTSRLQASLNGEVALDLQRPVGMLVERVQDLGF